jgi:ribonuclease HI
MMFTIFADGGARGNPGPAGAGAYITDESGKEVVSVSVFLGVRTNNYAEYEAIILGLEKLLDIIALEPSEPVDVLVCMDSELVIKQLRGEYKVKHPDMKTQFARVAPLISAFRKVSFKHVPREKNKDADRLANEAMDRAY